MTVFTAAVVQAAPVAFDLDRSIEKLADLTADAAASGAEVVLFPEAFLSAYPKGLDFGARIGSRSPAGRADFQRYFESSVALDGPELPRLAEIAASRSVHLVVGAIERDGGTLYCSVLFFSPDGRFLGHHRKLMPTASERLVWGTGDGSTLPVFDTPCGVLGAVICWENYMPLLRAAMYAKGIQIYCAPTVDARETWAPTMRHIAIEGRCFVLSANQFARRSDFPADYDCVQGDDPDTVMIAGGSCIVDPFGSVLAGPNYESECILTAEIDLAAITRGKYDLDVMGHYARPDVFELHVDERARRPVRFVDGERGGEG
jgi:nitrilase